MTDDEVGAYVWDVFSTLEAAAGDTPMRKREIRIARGRMMTIVGALLIQRKAAP
jgi:hypothetical protein